MERFRHAKRASRALEARGPLQAFSAESFVHDGSRSEPTNGVGILARGVAKFPGPLGFRGTGETVGQAARMPLPVSTEPCLGALAPQPSVLQ